MLTFRFGSQRVYILANLLLAVSLLFANAAYALGMGKIKAYSYLDEPLVAEIELIGTEGLDPYQLIVKLASAQDFARAGMERPFFLNNIDFDVIFYDGKGYIFMRSVKPVQLPYLEFLVELSWPEGSLIKDYTVLIDPPPPNLSKENRPLAYGQLAQIEAQQRSFGTDVISEQLSEQELIGSGSRLLTPNKTEQKSFSDQDVQVVTSETGEVTVSDTPELVPEVVPDITEEDLEPNPSASPNKQSQNSSAPAVSAEKSKVVTTQKDAVTKTNNTKFVDQLAEFDKKQQEQFSQTKRQSWVGSLAPAEKVLPEESAKKTKKTIQQPEVIVEQPATVEQIQQEIAAEQSSPPVEEEIDFATVIEPVAPEPPETVASQSTSEPDKMVVSTDEEGGSIILPLLFTLFALGLLAVGGFALKKYILDKKAAAAKDKQSDTGLGTDQQQDYAWDDEAELDDEFEVVDKVTTSSAPVEAVVSKDGEAEVAATPAAEKSSVADDTTSLVTPVTPVSPATPIDTPEEEIELAPPPPQQDTPEQDTPEQDTPEDLAAVEAELANLDLNIISPEPDSKIEEPQTATEVLNIETDVEIPVAGKEAPDLFPEPEIEIDSSLKLAPEPDESDNSGPEVEKSASIESLSESQPALRDADIDMKLELARKYIDAGDKESAKSLLLEVQDIAKDEQKVEIEMLLSTLP